MSTGSRNQTLHALLAKSAWSATTVRELVLRNREFEEPLSLRELVEVAQGAFPLLLRNVIRDEIISAVDIPERWELVERLRMLADRLESGEFTGVPSAQGSFVTERDAKVFKDCVQPYMIHVPVFTERATRRDQFLQELRKYFRKVDPAYVSSYRHGVEFRFPLQNGDPVEKLLHIGWLTSEVFELQYYRGQERVAHYQRTSLKDLIQEFKRMLSVSEELL